MKNLTFLIFALLFFVAGCTASAVERINDSKVYRYDGQKFNKVELIIREDATDDLGDIIRFDQDELRNMIEHTLDVKGLKDVNSPNIVKIEINDVRVRSTSDVMVWGFMAGDDHIEGDILLLGENAVPFHAFHVAVSYARLAGFKEIRMSWLYEEFSKLTLQEILDKKSDAT